jgi:hypothetical protein
MNIDRLGDTRAGSAARQPDSKGDDSADDGYGGRDGGGAGSIGG